MKITAISGSAFFLQISLRLMACRPCFANYYAEQMDDTSISAAAALYTDHTIAAEMEEETLLKEFNAAYEAVEDFNPFMARWLQDLERAQALWESQEIVSYAFVLYESNSSSSTSSSTTNQVSSREVFVEVEGDTSLQNFKDLFVSIDGSPVPVFSSSTDGIIVHNVPTVQWLFKKARQAIKDDAIQFLHVQYDEQFGFPTKIYLNRHVTSSDGTEGQVQLRLRTNGFEAYEIKAKNDEYYPQDDKNNIRSFNSLSGN